MRIRGCFSKPKEVCEKKSVGNTVLERQKCKLHKFSFVNVLCSAAEVFCCEVITISIEYLDQFHASKDKNNI